MAEQDQNDALRARRQAVRDGLDERPASQIARHLRHAAEYREEILAGGSLEPGPDVFKEREGGYWVEHSPSDRRELKELARDAVDTARSVNRVAAAVEAMTGVPVRAIISATDLDRHLAQEERSKARAAAIKTPTHAHVERMNAAAQRQAANSEALER